MGYIDVSAQALTFFMSLLLGCVLCLFYDVVRALHKVCIKGFFEVLVCDVLFWVVATVITFCFLVIRCNGSVRAFVLIGELIGAVVTRITLSKLFLLVLSKIFMVIQRIFSWLGGLFGKVFKYIEKFFKKMRFISKKVLQDKYKLLYNLLKTRKQRDIDTH